MSERARRIGRNLAAMSLAQLVSRGFAFVTTIHLARVLGADNFGVIVFALALLTYAELVVNFGFHRIGPRQIARDESQLGVLVQTIVTLRLLLVGLALVGMLLFVWLWPGEGVVKQVTLLYSLALFAVALDLSWAFTGLESMGVIAVAEIISQALMVSAVLLLIRQPDDLILVPLIYLATMGAKSGVMLVEYGRRFGRFKLGLPTDLWRTLGRAAVPLAISGAMGTITFNFDTLMVGFLLGTREAGLYGAAYRIVWLPSIAATSFFTALFPAIDRAYKGGLAEASQLLDKSVRLTVMLGLGLGVGGTLLAEDGFALIYGPEFQAAVPPFQILIWSITILFINRNYRVLLVSFGQQQAELRMITLSATTNIVLNLLFIPRWGLAGAAVATVVSELVILVVGYTLVHRLIGHVPLGRHLWKPAIAALVMGGGLYLMAEWHLFWQIPLGSALYGLVLLLTGSITFRDLQQLQAIISK